MNRELVASYRVLANLTGVSGVALVTQAFLATTFRDPFGVGVSGSIRIAGALTAVGAGGAAIWVRRWGLRPSEWLTEAGAKVASLANANSGERVTLLCSALARRAWALGLISCAFQVVSATPALVNAIFGGSALDIYPTLAVSTAAVILCAPRKSEFDALERGLRRLIEPLSTAKMAR